MNVDLSRFTVDLTGGVAGVTCKACGQGMTEPYRPEIVLETWCAEHECESERTSK